MYAQDFEDYFSEIFTDLTYILTQYKRAKRANSTITLQDTWERAADRIENMSYVVSKVLSTSSRKERREWAAYLRKELDQLVREREARKQVSL